MSLSSALARRKQAGDRPEAEPADLRGTRMQASQRIQLGIAGIGAMLLLVALASTIMEQAREAEDPQIAAQAGPAEQANRTDPLVDIGVAPELPAEAANKNAVRDLPVAADPPAADGITRSGGEENDNGG